MPDRLARHRFDHRGVVDEGHLPDLACPLTSEAQHRLRIAVGHAGEEETGIPPAGSGGNVRPLHEQCVHASCAEVMQEADASDAAADDEHVGVVGQLAGITLGWPPPERSQFRGPNNIELRHGF